MWMVMVYHSDRCKWEQSARRDWAKEKARKIIAAHAAYEDMQETKRERSRFIIDLATIAIFGVIVAILVFFALS